MVHNLLCSDKINDIADVQLFFCHFYLDLNLVFQTGMSFYDIVSKETGKRSFTNHVAAYYDKLLDDCYRVCDEGFYHVEEIASKIATEYFEWLPGGHREDIKKILIMNNQTFHISYKAEFKSDAYPVMAILYSDDNFVNKKVGYGILVLDDEHYTYKFYDNKKKTSFIGEIYQVNDGLFGIGGHPDKICTLRA